MNVTLHNDEETLPRTFGNHVFIYTGTDPSASQENPEIVTEIHCAYSVGDQNIHFKKNADSFHLRFEDAMLWAIGYAKTIGVTNIHAVFKLARPVDLRFLRKFNSIFFIDKRRESMENGLIQHPFPSLPLVTGTTAGRMPRASLQRHAVLRGKLEKSRSVHRNRKFSAIR